MTFWIYRRKSNELAILPENPNYLFHDNAPLWNLHMLVFSGA
jgi:hypothetical protein